MPLLTGTKMRVAGWQFAVECQCQTSRVNGQIRKFRNRSRGEKQLAIYPVRGNQQPSVPFVVMHVPLFFTVIRAAHQSGLSI
jgi:hypothetical protein